MSAGSNFCLSPKISESGSKVMVVPVWRVAPSALSFVSAWPLAYSCVHFRPSRFTSATSLELKALTTEDPTPCRPPEWM